MGTYCALHLNGQEIASFKSSPEPLLATVFRPHDRRVIPADPDDVDAEATVDYVTTARVAIERLAIIGIHERVVAREFESARRIEIADLEAEGEKEMAAPVRWMTWDRYRQSLATLLAIEHGVLLSHFHGHSTRDELGPEQREYYDHYADDTYWGYVGRDDVRYALLPLLLNAPEAAELRLELTALVSGLFIETDGRPWLGEGLERLRANEATAARTIVLCEGTSDAELIRDSLALLYPEVSDYFVFPDFGEWKPPGGAGTVIATVKYFATCEVRNRIVALLDNDTAAADSVRSLQSRNLPTNIVVKAYPELEFVRSYPTKGPQGDLLPVDINGRAVSLELFFGDDVLLRDGQYVPVQWQGYVETMNRYQGSIMRKSELQAAYREKLRRCKHSEDAFAAADWKCMRLLLHMIFRAFDEEAAAEARASLKP